MCSKWCSPESALNCKLHCLLCTLILYAMCAIEMQPYFITQKSEQTKIRRRRKITSNRQWLIAKAKKRRGEKKSWNKMRWDEKDASKKKKKPYIFVHSLNDRTNASSTRVHKHTHTGRSTVVGIIWILYLHLIGLNLFCHTIEILSAVFPCFFFYVSFHYTQS